MADLIPPALLVLLGLVLAVSLLALPRDLRRFRERRRRVVPAGLVGGIDEVFHPEAHEALLVWEAQVETPALVPAPGEPAFPTGRITLHLDDDDRRGPGASGS